MIMRRPYSRTATRRDTLAEGMRNTQITAGQVKEQAKGDAQYRAAGGCGGIPAVSLAG